MPNTKPDLFFDHLGVCAACKAFAERVEIDWSRRRSDLELILDEHRSRNGEWDCVIPVSGGKDSTYQVIKALELGMTPLCVTATTCDISDIGLRNIENLKRLGVDHIQFSPNPKVRARLNKLCLTEVGDIAWPEHVGIFTTPVKIAIKFGIKLLIWGENSQNEYGGPSEASNNNVLDRAWLEEFGGLLGLRTSDLVQVFGFSNSEVFPYEYPDANSLESNNITGIFLGHYLPWDGLSNHLLAQAHGFMTPESPVEGSMVNYENLDNHQHGIHDYFKFLKFGYSRTTDQVSMHLRRSRLTRYEAIEIVRERDGKFPWRYLGKDLSEILKPLNMTVAEFVEVCDKFTTRNLFLTNENGELIKDSQGNLTKINYDNV
jgi:N-acetyl sugar amidotransferase